MNPYQQLSEKSFWKLAVADKDPLSITDLWNPLFQISKSAQIVTVGSCFAQHISKALANAGYNWLNAEPAPRFLSDALREKYGYGLFSFRTGNIYTAALLRQWLSWAVGDSTPPDEAWENNGRFYDPFRPNIEPQGFRSREELFELRKQTLDAILEAARSADLWIFTLGLTEAWHNSRGKYWYPMCPGTVAGEFDSSMHRFHNFSYPEIVDDLAQVIQLVRQQNGSAKFLLTVSPVPLTATASENHVLIATEYSKATLRAVAEDTKRTMNGIVDYFPSYEIITSIPYKGVFFNQNLRTVSEYGVSFVMNQFFSAVREHKGQGETPAHPPAAGLMPIAEQNSEPQCEDALLEAFGRK
jgi:hypothetical protein